MLSTTLLLSGDKNVVLNPYLPDFWPKPEAGTTQIPVD
jgi:hypothetical protein